MAQGPALLWITKLPPLLDLGNILPIQGRDQRWAAESCQSCEVWAPHSLTCRTVQLSTLLDTWKKVMEMSSG